MLAKLNLRKLPLKCCFRGFGQGTVLRSAKDGSGEKAVNAESERMKKFHEKLRLEPIKRISPGMRFVDLVLVETDLRSGEMIANSEKDPTKWGDWQQGGRVSDF